MKIFDLVIFTFFASYMLILDLFTCSLAETTDFEVFQARMGQKNGKFVIFSLFEVSCAETHRFFDR